MARDEGIETIFTTADDQMQGLWGLHRYLKTATDITAPEKLIPYLPQGAFRLTHHWARKYEAGEMVRAMSDGGIDFLLSRSSLVSLVTICEAALDRFNNSLVDLRKCDKKTGHKQLLSWAFEIMKGSSSGSPEMLIRLPQTCGDLDNARRLRNCIVHNNGAYDREYLSNVINDGWVKIQHERDSGTGVTGRDKIFLQTERFEYFSRSHIEFLHILHNTIQLNFFGHSSGYSYAEEGKGIEWYRVLSGRKIVDL
jgi:hypothetical protein